MKLPFPTAELGIFVSISLHYSSLMMKITCRGHFLLPDHETKNKVSNSIHPSISLTSMCFSFFELLEKTAMRIGKKGKIPISH